MGKKRLTAGGGIGQLCMCGPAVSSVFCARGSGRWLGVKSGVVLQPMVSASGPVGWLGRWGCAKTVASLHWAGTNARGGISAGAGKATLLGYLCVAYSRPVAAEVGLHVRTCD